MHPGLPVPRVTPTHASVLLAVRPLRGGRHVQLDLGWLRHPFPLSSFRIASEQQLQTLRELGLERVRVLPERSDAAELRQLVEQGALAADALGLPMPAADAAPTAPVTMEESPEALARRQRQAALEAERALAALAERRHGEAHRTIKRGLELAERDPQAARELCEGQVLAMLDTLLGEREIAIRLLGECAGDRAALHGINVTVVSLLLGQQMGLTKAEMFDLGVGAMLHDIGKRELPDRVRWLDALDPGVPAHERQYYQEHVALGTAIGRRMGLAGGALEVIAQHHEHADGTGFPRRLAGCKLSSPARIAALVNRYDKLCNPAIPADALTPHEALATLYGQSKAKFDAAVFGAFIRMMGVYPPGSLVQLSDERLAMVLTVNASRPLKPRVLVHDPKLPREEPLPVDLETRPDLAIRRSIKPQQLPRSALDSLSPRSRVCYFSARARAAGDRLPGGAPCGRPRGPRCRCSRSGSR